MLSLRSIIGFAETALREKARAARGRWDPAAKAWFIRFSRIKGTDLEKHIILDAGQSKPKQGKASNSRCSYPILDTGKNLGDVVSHYA